MNATHVSWVGRPKRSRPLYVVAAVLLGALPSLAGCVAGELDGTKILRGRVCFPEPPIRLRLEVPKAFHDSTGDAPQILGKILADGAAGMVQRSHIFAVVTGPAIRSGMDASAGPPALRTVRLEGQVTSFSYFQDYRWLGLYGFIVVLPVIGISAIALGLFLLGVPVYTDRGEIAVELRLRDGETGELLGTYRGQASADFHHGLHNFDTFSLSFWSYPETLLGLALRRSLLRLVEDRAVYRRLAARQRR